MKITCVSFNLRCRSDPGPNSIEERGERLQAILAPLDPDVICFQEYRPAWEREVANRFLKTYDSYFAMRSRKNPEGLVILWKKGAFCALKRGHFWLSDKPQQESRGWDEKYNCPRIASFAVLRKAGSGIPFCVATTHFGFGEACQVKSARLLESFFQAHRSLPIALMGDFNMKPTSPGYREMIRFAADANREPVEGRRSTYHGYMPEKHPDSHIDYCFLSDSFRVNRFHLIDETVHGFYPSDHYGLFAELEGSAL